MIALPTPQPRKEIHFSDWPLAMVSQARTFPKPLHNSTEEQQGINKKMHEA